MKNTQSRRTCANLLGADARNAAHRERVYRIVAGNRHNANTIRHDDMFALAQDAEAGLFSAFTASRWFDAGNLRHVTPPRLTSRNVLTFHEVVDGGKVLANASWIFFERFGFGLAWDQQPGRPGHETLNPSSDSLTTTL